MKQHWPKTKTLIGRPSLKENRRTGAKRRVGHWMSACMHKYFDIHGYLPNKIIRHEANYCLCMLTLSWSRLPKTLTSTIILVSHGHVAMKCSLSGHNKLCSF